MTAKVWEVALKALVLNILKVLLSRGFFLCKAWCVLIRIVKNINEASNVNSFSLQPQCGSLSLLFTLNDYRTRSFVEAKKINFSIFLLHLVSIFTNLFLNL